MILGAPDISSRKCAKPRPLLLYTDLGHEVAAETDLVVHALALFVAHDLVVGVEVQLVGGTLGGAESAPTGEGGLRSDLELIVLAGHGHRRHGAERGRPITRSLVYKGHLYKKQQFPHSLIELEGLCQVKHADVVGGAEVALVLPDLSHVPLLLSTVVSAQSVVACSAVRAQWQLQNV